MVAKLFEVWWTNGLNDCCWGNLTNCPSWFDGVTFGWKRVTVCGGQVHVVVGALKLFWSTWTNLLFTWRTGDWLFWFKMAGRETSWKEFCRLPNGTLLVIEGKMLKSSRSSKSSISWLSPLKVIKLLSLCPDEENPPRLDSFDDMRLTSGVEVSLDWNVTGLPAESVVMKSKSSSSKMKRQSRACFESVTFKNHYRVRAICCWRQRSLSGVQSC